MTICNCKSCQELKEYKRLGVPQSVINKIMDLEMDVDYYNGLIDGKWPSSVEILEEALEKAKLYRKSL